jgi:hypothetical protein
VSTPTAVARRGPGDLLVLGAALTTGALGAVTLIIAQRHLDLQAFAPLAQLWTIWAVLAAGFTFSFQQWAAVQEVDRRSLLPGGAGSRLLVGLLLIGLAILVLTGVARETIFQSPSMVWPIAAALLPIGTAFNGVRRGQLARHRLRRHLAGVIAGENAIRLAVTLVLVGLDAEPEWFAVAVLAGFVVVIGPTRGTSAISEAPDRAGRATLGAAATAGFLAHAFMFGSPILLALAGASASEVSALFLVLTGVRMPFIVLQAVVPQLAVSLAASPDRPASIARVRRTLVVFATVGASVGALGGFLLGDLIIGTVFGIRGDVSAATYGLLAGSSVLAASALVATVVLVVERRTRRILIAWGLPAASAIVVTLTGTIDQGVALATWLLVAHASVALLALVPARPDPAERPDDNGHGSRTHDEPAPRNQP